jgi:hypothetical protein
MSLSVTVQFDCVSCGTDSSLWSDFSTGSRRRVYSLLTGLSGGRVPLTWLRGGRGSATDELVKVVG